MPVSQCERNTFRFQAPGTQGTGSVGSAMFATADWTQPQIGGLLSEVRQGTACVPLPCDASHSPHADRPTLSR